MKRGPAGFRARAALASLMFTLCGAAVASAADEPAPQGTRMCWPAVRPGSWTFAFGVGKPLHVRLPIPLENGSPGYVLECTGESDLEFDCELSAQDGSKNLLIESVERLYWESRARFGQAIENVRDQDCGPSRLFRMRGFSLRITVRLSETPVDRKGIPTGDVPARRLTIEVAKDDTALAESAILEGRALPRVPHIGPHEPDWRGCGVPADERNGVESKHRPRVPVAKIAPLKEVLPLPASMLTNLPTRIPITTIRGDIAYELECWGERKYAVARVAAIDFVGFWCRLLPTGERRDLLAEDVDRYSARSRAWFRPADLVGSCASYPRWGAAREFRLPGFRLTLTVRHQVVTKAEDLTAGELVVTVAPSTDASRPLVEYVDPGVFRQRDRNDGACDVPRFAPLDEDKVVYCAEPPPPPPAD